jgi:hypothetical protein
MSNKPLMTLLAVALASNPSQSQEQLAEEQFLSPQHFEASDQQVNEFVMPTAYVSVIGNDNPDITVIHYDVSSTRTNKNN